MTEDQALTSATRKRFRTARNWARRCCDVNELRVVCCNADSAAWLRSGPARVPARRPRRPLQCRLRGLVAERAAATYRSAPPRRVAMPTPRLGCGEGGGYIPLRAAAKGCNADSAAWLRRGAEHQ